MPPSSPDPAPALTRPQIVLSGMRAGSTQLASRMVGAVAFHEGIASRSSAQEALHPQHVHALVRRLRLDPKTLRRRGPLAVLERIWSEYGPCPVKIMPNHFLHACWRFQCEHAPGVMYAKWLREGPAELVLLRRRNLMAQVASAVRAEVTHIYDLHARTADQPLPWTDNTDALVARAAERVGFDDLLISRLIGVRVVYEMLCECGFEHPAVPGTQHAPLPPTRDIADVGHILEPDHVQRFCARARASLARARLRAVREVLRFIPPGQLRRGYS